MVQTKWRKCPLVQSSGDFDWRAQFHNLPRRLWNFTVAFSEICVRCTQASPQKCVASASSREWAL